MVTWKAELASTEENPVKSRVSVRSLPGRTKRNTKIEPITNRMIATATKTIRRVLKALFLWTMKISSSLCKSSLMAYLLFFIAISVPSAVP